MRLAIVLTVCAILAVSLARLEPRLSAQSRTPPDGFRFEVEGNRLIAVKPITTGPRAVRPVKQFSEEEMRQFALPAGSGIRLQDAKPPDPRRNQNVGAPKRAPDPAVLDGRSGPRLIRVPDPSSSERKLIVP